MALERFSVDNFLAQNGYKTKAFTGSDNTNPSLPIFTSGSSKNKTNDLERFSVDGWLSKNGYESFNIDRYEAPYVEQKVDDALSFVGEQPQEDKSGSIGEIAKALVGSLGAGVVNMLRTADTTLSGAAKYINSSVMQGAYWLDEQVKGKEYIDEVAWGNKARAEALNPQNNGVAPVLRDVENGIRKWADTQNEGWLTRAVAGAVESTPAMVASKVMPLVGSAMLFNQAFSNTLEGDIIAAQQKNQPIDYNMLMTKAVASGAIELATEKLFNLFGGMKGAAGEILHGGNKGIVGTALATFNGFKKEFIKEGGDELAEFGVREFGKFMFKKAAEEGTEEIASTFLNGVVALGTTDAGKKLFWFQGEDAVIQWEEVRDSFVGGAIMGGAFGAWNYSNQAKAYKKAAPNTDAYLNEQQKKPLSEVGAEDVGGLYDAMQKDVAENDLGTVAAQVSMESTAAVQQKIEDGTLRTDPVSYEELPQSTIQTTVTEPIATVEQPIAKDTSKLSEWYLEELPRVEKLIATSADARVAYERERMNILDDAAYDVLSHANDNEQEVRDYFKQRYEDAKNGKYEDSQLNRIILYADKAAKEGLGTGTYTFVPKYMNALEGGAPVKIPQSIGQKIYKNIAEIGQSESQTKSKSESFNEALENMANQEPSADVQGIVSPDFAAVMGDMKTSKFNSNGYNGVFDSDVRKRIDDSMSITHDKTIKEKIAQFKAFFTKSFLRGSVNIPYSYGELRQRIQSYRNANQSADTSIENYILRIYNPVGKQNYKLMRDAVLMLDLKEDIIDKHLYEGDNAKPLPFGIKTVSDAMQMITDVEQQLKNPKNESVVKAVAARRNIMDIMRKQLVDTAGAVGWDLSYLEGRTNYMHHAIMEYVDEESKSKYKGGSKSSSYKGREGSYKDYVSDPALSDYLVMRKMMKDMMKIGVYSELKTLDIKDTLSVDADGRLIVPDGYAEFDRKQMGLSYMDKNGSPDDAAVQFMQSTADKLGIPSNVVDKVVENAQSKKNDSVIVIPMDVRDAVAEEFEIKKSSNQAFNLQRMATQAWKRWQLESLRRFIKYNIKNLAGDTDAMLMIYPQTVKKVAQSFRELTDLYKNGKTTARLAEYAKFGGLSTSLSTVELGDLQSLPNFTFYESEENVGKLAVNKMRRITQSIDKFTEWREQLLRYAAYLQQVEDLSNSKDGLPKNYGASKPAEIKSINTIEGRAFKLSNDALGAYNDVTPMAQGMSKTVYPFFRFKEVNMRRFFRLAKNAFYVDTDTTMSAGESVAAKLAGGAKVTGYAALRIGKIALGYAAFVGSLALWNRIAAPDEEDELPEDVRNTVHIVFPKWATGGELMYFSDLSSFYQLFNDIGFAGVGDVANDLKEIVNGKMTIGDKVKEIANSSASSFMNGMAPFFKPVMEAIVGKTIYPDISKPGTVRDPWEHIFKSVSLDSEYRALTGKALPGGSYLATWRKAFVNSIVPGEAALSDVYDMKERYYSSIGKTGFSGGTKDAKANAIYNYKVALKYGDTAAAERYLKQYALFGGTQATFEKSLAALDPTYGMSKEDKKKFVAGMSKQETETYNRAVEYFKSIQASGNPSTLPKK